MASASEPGPRQPDVGLVVTSGTSGIGWPAEYLQDLDDLPASKRRLDNVDAKFIADPAGMTDLAFADAMVDEWDTWIVAATSAGVLN